MIHYDNNKLIIIIDFYFHMIMFKLNSLWGRAQMKSNQINTYQIVLVFAERVKLEYLEKNLSEQSREPMNSTHI